MSGGVAFWTDAELSQDGVILGFTERLGGVSQAPYLSLNLATHVGDDAAKVAENQGRALAAMRLDRYADRLTVAEQVHSDHISLIGSAQAGRGSCGRPSIPSTDAMITAESGLPLLMCFADCVPIVMVAPGPVIAVVHAGWRGALAGIAGSTANALSHHAACEPADLAVYVGPHIGACHYEIGQEILSQFTDAFGTVARAESGGLDLGAVVAANLTDAGVQSCRIVFLGRCTAEETDRFFSYRAEAGITGRHGAIACIAR